MIKITKYSVNDKIDVLDLQELAEKLTVYFKKAAKLRLQRIHFQGTVYSINSKKDPKNGKFGEFGRDNLINHILKSISYGKILENIQILDNPWKVQEFIDSIKPEPVEEVNSTWLNNLNEFRDRFTTGAFNIFRWYLIGKHRKAQDNNVPVIWRNTEIDLTSHRDQAKIYGYLLKTCKNPYAFRLALAYQHHWDYMQVDFDRFMNKLQWNYKHYFKSSEMDYGKIRRRWKNKDISKIVKLSIDFSLLLQREFKITIEPSGWMNRLYHLHENFFSDRFRNILDELFNYDDFLQALKYGLIKNPWDVLTDCYNLCVMKGDEGKASWKYDFIRSADDIIDKFNLKPLRQKNNGKEK